MRYLSFEEMTSGKKMTKKEAEDWMNKVIECYRFLGSRATWDIYIGHPHNAKEIHMVGVANLALSACIPYKIEPWEDNPTENDILEVWFEYDGYRFFELVDDWNKEE